MRVRVYAVVALLLCSCVEPKDTQSLGQARQRQLETPVLSDEIVLDDQPVPTLEQADNRAVSVVSVAAGAGIFLTLRGAQGSFPARAFRVDGTGAVLDPGGIALGPGPLYQPPLAVYVGSRFYVAIPGNSKWMTPSGTITSAPSFPAANENFGNYFLVAGSDGFAIAADGTAHSVTRFDSNATVVGTTEFATYGMKALAYSSGNYWLAWIDCEDVNCSTESLRLSRIRETDGVILDAGGIELSRLSFPYYGVALACGQSTCLVAWTENPPQGCEPQEALKTLVQRFDSATGAPVDATAVTIASEIAFPTFECAVSATPTGFVVGFAYQNQFQSVFVPSNGAFSNATPKPLTAPPARGLAMAFNGSDHLAAWGVPRGRAVDTAARLVGADGTPGASVDLEIRDVTNNQEAPAVANDGTNYLVAWQDFRGDRSEVMAVRVDPTGAVLDSPIPMPRSSPSKQQYGPKIVFDGTDYIVTWVATQFDISYPQSEQLLGVRVTRDGSVRDTVPFVIGAVDGRITDHALGIRGSAVDAFWETSPSCGVGNLWSTTLFGGGADAPTARDGGLGIRYARILTATAGATELLLLTDPSGFSQGFLVGAASNPVPIDVGSVFSSVIGLPTVGFSSLTSLQDKFVIGTRLSPSVWLYEPPSTITPLTRPTDPEFSVLASDGQRIFGINNRSSGADYETVVTVVDPVSASLGPSVVLPKCFSHAMSSRAPGEVLLAYISGVDPIYRVRARLMGVAPAPLADGGAGDASRDASSETAPEAAVGSGGAPSTDASRDGRKDGSDGARATGGARSTDASHDVRTDAPGGGGRASADGALVSGGRSALDSSSGPGGSSPRGTGASKGSGGAAQGSASGGSTSNAGTSGRAGSSGAAQEPDASNDLAGNAVSGSGCDCRLSPRPASAPSAALLVALGLAFSRRWKPPSHGAGRQKPGS